MPIVFGYPTHETFEAAERGEVLLGGCVVDGTEPDARCPACRADLRRSRGRWAVAASGAGSLRHESQGAPDA